MSLNSSAISSKETNSTESYFPRLRRGRRRADEARLDLWGFATPSPPPPPMPAPPVSLPTTHTQPTRRPRGRPRSNPLPQRVFPGKGKNANTEDEAPSHKKRQRCRSKKYQTGEYITDKVKLEDGEHPEESESLKEESAISAGKQFLKFSSYNPKCRC